jgi:uncharacterized Zn finger protein (UPF0148 family)
MAERMARLIDEPAKGTRTVIAPDKPPAFEGKGTLSILCGRCGTPLVKNIEEGQISSIVVKCPFCGAFNDIDSD